MIIKKITSPLIALPRFIKRLIVVGMDVGLCLTTVWIAFYLRLDQTELSILEQRYVYILAPLFAVPVFMRLGLYRAIFRYTGIASMVTIVKAILIYSVIFFSALLAIKFEGVPRSIGLIQPLILLLLVAASRAIAKLFLSGWQPTRKSPTGRLLIYGAGEAGIQTAFALSTSRKYRLLAFIDEDISKIGRSINGIDVISSNDVPAAVERMGITDILLAMPSLGRQRRNEIITRLGLLSVHVQTLPSVLDLASGKVTIQDFQELDAEDLLGRAPVQPKSDLFAKSLSHKTVLVTGAGGSIGSELCRQIALELPNKLILIEHNEFSLYSIHQELSALCKDKALAIDLVPLLASVSNYQRLSEIFQLYKPTNVYHAAAYKHVPLVESNPSEGILNNVWGTFNVARASIESNAEKFLLVSTDKAVRPTNIMGATKRVAELVLQALNASASLNFSPHAQSSSQTFNNQTLFSMVRFGNVLGSSGSVVPLFRKQLFNGGPLTVTDAEVTRYFMTIPEAAQLVLQAAAMAEGGDVFVLDMGQPVKILDLARKMIELSGMTLRDNDNPDGDIEIAITGLRPGEKLYEELLIGENPETTSHERIMKAKEDFLAWHVLQPLLLKLKQAAETGNIDAMRQNLIQLVPGYHPSNH
jgi:FlaA1/EpsC-like NDP-sugar epimerase